jgi:hypothetical protein
MKFMLVPETPDEEGLAQEWSHVKQWCLFGMQALPDAAPHDFHHYHGQHAFLIGHTHYLGHVITDDWRVQRHPP